MPQNAAPRSLPTLFTTLILGLLALTIALPTLLTTVHTPTPSTTTAASAAYTGAALAPSTFADPALAAHAGEAVCTTDLDCAAWELQQAIQDGERVHEDLSFQGASELYSAKNDLLADAFWATHAGEDWTDVERHLGAWLEAYRAC